MKCKEVEKLNYNITNDGRRPENVKEIIWDNTIFPS